MDDQSDFATLQGVISTVNVPPWFRHALTLQTGESWEVTRAKVGWVRANRLRKDAGLSPLPPLVFVGPDDPVTQVEPPADQTTEEAEPPASRACWTVPELEGPALHAAKALADRDEKITVRAIVNAVANQYPNRNPPSNSTMTKTVAWKQFGSRKIPKADPSRAVSLGSYAEALSVDDDVRRDNDVRRNEAGGLDRLPGETEDDHQRRVTKAADLWLKKAPK